MSGRAALWLVRDNPPALIADADRAMMAHWLRATAENEIKKHGERGRVTMSAKSARALAEMLDTKPVTEIR